MPRNHHRRFPETPEQANVFDTLQARRGPPEWETRAQDGRVNRLCACGQPAETGVICNACRRSNEPED